MKNVKKFIFMVVLGIMLMSINSNNAEIVSSVESPAPDSVIYSINAKEEVYIGGKHKITLYSAPEFIFEDNIWKNKSQARSLKGYYIFAKTTDDPDYGMELVDVNLTSATFELEVKNPSHLNKKVPLKKKDIILNNEFANISTPEFSAINEKKQVFYKVDSGDSVMNYNFGFGLNTTTGFIMANTSSGNTTFKDSGTIESNNAQKNSTTGTDAQINPYGNTQNTTMLAWFNVSRAVGGVKVTVINASWVFQSLNSLNNTKNVSVVETKVYWEEGSGPGWTPGNVSFTYPNSTSCGTCPSWQGGKMFGYRGRSLADNILSTKGENTNITVDFNIAVVQDWINNPNSNYGWQVIPDFRTDGDNVVIATREHATKAWQFIMEYTTNLAPTVISNYTLPPSPAFNDNFNWYVEVNGTEKDDRIEYVNMTITYPNGTIMLNAINGSSNYTSATGFYNFSSPAFKADDGGTYTLTADVKENTTTPLVSITKTFNISDDQAPNVTIVVPTNNSQIVGSSSVAFNFSTNDNRRVRSCFYYLDMTGNNVSISNCANFTLTLGTGNHNMTIFANDSLNNVGRAYVNFSLANDTQAPNLTISTPTGTQTSRTVTANFNITDNSALSLCRYNITDGSGVFAGGISENRIISNCATNSSLTFTVNADLSNLRFNLWANDTSGNFNSTFSTFTVDTAVSGGSPGGGGGSPQAETMSLVSLGQVCTENSACSTGVCDLEVSKTNSSVKSTNYGTCQTKLCGNNVCSSTESTFSCAQDCALGGLTSQPGFFARAILVVAIIGTLVLFIPKGTGKNIFTKIKEKFRRK